MNDERTRRVVMSYFEARIASFFRVVADHVQTCATEFDATEFRALYAGPEAR